MRFVVWATKHNSFHLSLPRCRAILRVLVLLSIASIVTFSWKALNISYVMSNIVLQKIPTNSSHTKVFSNSIISQTISPLRDFEKPLISIKDFTLKPTEKCLPYLTEGMMQRFVYHNIYNATAYTAIGLVTQFNVKRLDMFMSLVDHWDGVISAAFYVEGKDYGAAFWTLMRKLIKSKRKKWVYVHAVIEHGKYYPINYLRNVAQNGSRKVCDFILQTDVDFMPSTNLYGALMQQINTGFFHRHKPKLLVVPAFEYKAELPVTAGERNMSFLDSKQQLLDLWNQSIIMPFHIIKDNGQESLAHAPTNFTKWKSWKSHLPYKINYVYPFEPYILLPQWHAPPFIPFFLQRYINKAAYFLELHIRGFEIAVIPNGFLVHLPHPSLHSKKLYLELYHCIHFVEKTLQAKGKQLQPSNGTELKETED